MVSLTCEFAGGLQALFDNKTVLQLEVEPNTNIKELVSVLRQKHLKRTEDAFVNEKQQLLSKKKVWNTGSHQ